MMSYFQHYQLFVITILCAILLPCSSKSQSYVLNKELIEKIKSDKKFSENILELNIDSTAKDDDIAGTLPEVKLALEELKRLENLRALHFNMLSACQSIDTIITFDPEDFDETVRVEKRGGRWSAYAILPILSSFQKLETLTLNFRGDNFSSSDFDLARIFGNVEKEMSLAFVSCLIKNNFEISDWTKYVSRMESPIGILDWEEWFQKQENFRIQEDTRGGSTEETKMTDEEYCRLQPDFCDEFGKPFFNRNEEEQVIDTAFLKEIGEWPPDTINQESAQENSSYNTCIQEVLKNQNWNIYGKSCYNLLVWSIIKGVNNNTDIDLITKYDLWKWMDYQNTESDELLYNFLSPTSQSIINKATDPQKPKIENRFNNEKIIRKLFLEETWNTLKPWGIQSREELLFEQLPKLKNLKNLHLANYYPLDLEKLLDILIKNQPDLERLLLSNCGITEIPASINQLKKLKHLGLRYNKMKTIPTLELPDLEYLCLEGNPISNLLRQYECLTYQEWKTFYSNYFTIDSIYLYGEDASQFTHRIPLSETYLTYAYRSKKDLYILNVEDVSFSGMVCMPSATVKTSSAYYEYKSHHLNLKTIEKLNLYGLNQKPIKSVIENFSGVLLIDIPSNKMGELYSGLIYPSLEAISKAKVYYDTTLYSKLDFYYELEPFIIDGLTKLDPLNLSFNGTLHSGGILGLLNEPLRLMPDYSLGLKVDFDEETPFYIKSDSLGEMYFKGNLQLDNQGLYGNGTLTNKKWMVQSDSILFTPNKIHILVSDNFKSEKALPKKAKKREWYCWEVYNKKGKWILIDN